MQSGIPSTPAINPRPVPASRRRRRTLGLCAHCHEPVDVGDEYVRLYRRAWHLDCALAAREPLAAQPPPGRLSARSA
jgi:hypothetical protein